MTRMRSVASGAASSRSSLGSLIVTSAGIGIGGTTLAIAAATLRDPTGSW